MLRLFLALWLSVTPAFAWAGSMSLLGAGKPPAAAGGGNVTIDAVGTAAFQASSNSFSYTGLTITGGLTNPGLVCWVDRADGANDVSAGLTVTWGAQAMTLRINETGGNTGRATALYGLRNPTSGNQTLTVAATNVAADLFVNCASFSNVNQTSDVLAFPNPTSTTSAVSIAVTSASGHIAVGNGQNGVGNGAIIGTTVLDDSTHGSILNVIGDYVVSSGASTTVGTTTTQSRLSAMDISN